MLEELLKYEKLGSRAELLSFLFDGLSVSRSTSISALRQFCIGQNFSIARSFDAILVLSQFLDFITVENDSLRINEPALPAFEITKNDYFNREHFFRCLIASLGKSDALELLFPPSSIKIDPATSGYFILDSSIPVKFFPVRNLLLNVQFLERAPSNSSHLIVNNRFSNFFRISVVESINLLLPKKGKLTLKDLKASLLAREEKGTEAEVYVLEIEKKRLNGHPSLSMVTRISETRVDAGYDIDSLLNHESVFIDKFIEVKSYADEIAFFWSKNEVETARELGENYYLYLVDRRRMNDATYQPKSISDPYRKIFLNEYWRKETQNWKITLENQGQVS